MLKKEASVAEKNHYAYNENFILPVTAFVFSRRKPQ